MVHLAFKYIAVIASSLLIIAVAQAEDRIAHQDKKNKKAESSDQAEGKLAVEKMQERMQRNTHHSKYGPKPVPKSALKK